MHEAVAGNLKKLMDHFGLTQEKLAEATGLAQRTIGYALKPGSIGSITTTTIEELAKYFKIEAYHLLIPDLPLEELLSRRLEHVIHSYAAANTEARENISRIAENELRYCLSGNKDHHI